MMKRQELLRQLDRDVEALKRGLGDVSKRLAQFKEEEERATPHGFKVGQFAISIDDGWSVWRFLIAPEEGGKLSTGNIIDRICKELRAVRPNGKKIDES
jgi:hypothetical protein